MSDHEKSDLQAEASALRQLATELVMELRLARRDAYGSDHAETADVFDLAASILDNRRAGQPLLEEIARLRTDLDLTCEQLRQAHAAETAERAARLNAGAELEDARAVIDAARVACHASLFDGRGPLVTAIARYDWWLQKAREP